MVENPAAIPGPIRQPVLQGAPAPHRPVLVEPKQILARLSTDMLAVGDAAILAGRCYRAVHQENLAAKIKLASELLTQTQLPLVAVAERAGFKHQEYMGAVFKLRIGRTLGQVRGADK